MSQPNGQVIVGGLVEPSDFRTREVGLILSVLPEIREDGRTIHLKMAPGAVDRPEWRDYGGRARYSDGTEIDTPMEQPFFRSNQLLTSVTIRTGSTVLVGGGTPSEDGKDFLYMFVTVRLVDAAGKPLSTQ